MGENSPTALVFSAAGMFGAYQAGVWKALSASFKPDLVVGTSAGAINSWIIAGGATPDELVGHWREPETIGIARFRRTLAPWRGVFDSAPLQERIKRIWEAYRPGMPVGITAVELPRLRLRLFTDGQITWKHLAASCAIPFGYRRVEIGGKRYVDGGLMETLPLGAAVEMGATRIVAVNALPYMPSRMVRAFVTSVRWFAQKAPAMVPVEVHTISPAAPLGTVRAALFWKQDAIERFIAQGEEDGASFASLPEHRVLSENR